LLGLAAVFEFVRIACGKPAWAAIAVAMLSCDFVYLTTASTGRMDTMGAALCLSALAVYVRLRERSPRPGLLAAHCLSAAAVFTHPVGGMVAIAALLAASRKDILRQRWTYLLLALPPYLAGALMWGAYIFRRPDLFVAQFFSNAEGRFTDVTNPIRMLKREIMERYLWNYGLATYSSPAGLAKLAILGFFVGSVLVLMFSVRLRRRLNAPLLLWVCFSSLAA
jgi:hypothetical protein